MHFKIPWRRTKVYVPLAVCLLFTCIAGCDTLPEPTDTYSRPPELTNLQYAPSMLDLATNPAAVVNGIVSVDFTVSVDAFDEDGVVEQVNFILRPPTAGSAPLANIVMNGDAAMREFGLTYTQQLPEGETGNYILEVYGYDNDGTLSNRVLGTFTLLNEQDPPIITAIEAPATVTRPAEGSVSFTLVATVDDPQGVANVSTVLAWNVLNPQATFALFDDGSAGGDEIAGDGRFTATVQISSDNSPGVNSLAFQATDRGGLQSEVVTIDITIE